MAHTDNENESTALLKIVVIVGIVQALALAARMTELITCSWWIVLIPVIAFTIFLCISLVCLIIHLARYS